MLKRHADILVGHLTELATNTNVTELVPKLVTNSIFTQEMIDRLLTDSPSAKLQAISLYLAVQRRGPSAFERLIRALAESNHTDLAGVLRRADIDAMHQEAPPQERAQSSTSAIPDSPDYSPTASLHHTCGISPSSHPFYFPNYINDDVRNAMRNGVRYEDDHVQLFGDNGPVTVRSAQTLKVPSDGKLPEKYKMTSKPRGYVLIVNNIVFDNNEFAVRNGARNDEEALVSLFEQLYFEVEVHQNKTREEMVQIVEEFSRKDAWSLVDCAFVIFMSHGTEGQSQEDTEIVGVDSLMFKTRDIISYFHNDSCPKLINKPKVFIFQSCRGVLSDVGVEIDPNNVYAYNLLAHRTETDGRVTRKLHRDRSRSDIFVIHPVPPGYAANRDRECGTWLIQTLVQIFSQHAHNLDLEDMIKIVDQRIKTYINVYKPNYQTVTTESIGWNKKLFFNPGLHVENGQTIRRIDPEEPSMDVVDTPSESQMNGTKDDKIRLKPEDSDDETSGCYKCRLF